MKTTARTRLAFIASGLLAAAPMTLLAQSEAESTAPPEEAMGPTQAMPSPETQTPVIEDQKVDQFAAAFVAVQNIQAEATQELSTAKDEQAATQVKASAEQKMVEAVKREGLEVEEFNRIADLMTTDLTLRSKVVEKVEKRRKG
ncbi:MAG: DUF4168 domain-containing protein [Povalibacter sp.]